MSALLYIVQPGSGGFVNGAEVAIGAEVALTEAEAVYELALGSVLPTGRAPELPIIPVLLPTDIVGARRGYLDRDVPVASLERFMAREGGELDAALKARGEALAAAVGGDLSATVAAVNEGMAAAVAAINDDMAALEVGVGEGLSAAVGTVNDRMAALEVSVGAEVSAALRGVGEDLDALSAEVAADLSAKLDSVGAVPAPPGLVSNLGAPALIQPNGHRWDFQRFATWRELVAIDAGRDARPAISRFLNESVPAYFGPGRYMLRSRDVPSGANGDYVYVPNPASVDVLCSGDAKFVIHADSNPFAGPGNIFRFGNGAEQYARRDWSRAYNSAKWIGGEISTAELDLTGISEEQLVLLGGINFVQFATAEIGGVVVNFGYKAPSRVAAIDPVGRAPGDPNWFPTYVYDNGMGCGDTGLGTNGCGSVYIHDNTVIGARDQGWYGSGRLGARLSFGADPISIQVGNTFATITTSAAHGRATGDIVGFVAGIPAVAGVTIAGNYVVTVLNATQFTVPLGSVASSSATGGGTGVRASVNFMDLPQNYAQIPQGFQHRIIANRFFRCLNAATDKRNVQGTEFSGNWIVECGGGWLTGGVGFTNGGSNTDPLSHGKRVKLHHNHYTRVWGPPITLIGQPNFHISHETIEDFGCPLAAPGEAITPFAIGNNISAIRLNSCSNGKVTNITIKQQDPLWAAHKYGKINSGGSVVDDLGRCLAGISIAVDGGYKSPCRDIDFSNILIDGVAWPVVKNTATDTGINFFNLRYKNEARGPRLSGPYSWGFSPSTEASFVPQITFSDGGSCTMLSSSLIRYRITDRGFEFYGKVRVDTKTADAAGRVYITGSFPVNATGQDVPVQIIRSRGAGAGVIQASIVPGENFIRLSIESSGVASALTAGAVPNSAEFNISGTVPLVITTS